MPVYKQILRYKETQSGMSWSVTNHAGYANLADAFLAANAWNDFYMAVCGSTVLLVDCRTSDVTLYRDIEVIPSTAFGSDAGLIAGEVTEIGSYAQARGSGSAVNQGSNAWKLHGISESLVNGSYLNIASADVIALQTACLAYFQQYRPSAGVRLPVIVGAAPFDRFSVTGMYFKRLGRPFGLPGQSR